MKGLVMNQSAKGLPLSVAPVMLLSANHSLLEELSGWLRHLGLGNHTHSFSTGANALQLLQTQPEQMNSVMVIEPRLPDVNGFQFINWIYSHKKLNFNPYIIVIYSQHDLRVPQYCSQANLSEPIPYPEYIHAPEFFLKLYQRIIDGMEVWNQQTQLTKSTSPPSNEKKTAVTKTSQDSVNQDSVYGFHGNLDDLSVNELVSMLSGKNHVSGIRVKSSLGEGEIWVGKGRVLGCRLGEESGLNAALKICTPSQGRFSILRGELPESLEPINMPAEELLFESAFLWDMRDAPESSLEANVVSHPAAKEQPSEEAKVPTSLTHKPKSEEDSDAVSLNLTENHSPKTPKLTASLKPVLEGEAVNKPKKKPKNVSSTLTENLPKKEAIPVQGNPAAPLHEEGEVDEKPQSVEKPSKESAPSESEMNALENGAKDTTSNDSVDVNGKESEGPSFKLDEGSTSLEIWELEDQLDAVGGEEARSSGVGHDQFEVGKISKALGEHNWLISSRHQSDVLCSPREVDPEFLDIMDFFRFQSEFMGESFESPVVGITAYGLESGGVAFCVGKDMCILSLDSKTQPSEVKKVSHWMEKARKDEFYHTKY